jgi:hypothetical protein
MNKFHHIPTDKFIPISHDNSYLFNHYDKVANFLAFNLNKNYKSILAKPVQNGYIIDWFSTHNELVDIKEYDTDSAEKALFKYWDFIEVIDKKIEELQNSNDENNRNWAGLLKKVFNHKDNFIFFNGTNICVVWGWKFENTENYKPNFQSISHEPETISEDPIDSSQETKQKEEEETIENNEPIQENQEEVVDEEIVDEEIYEEEILKDKPGFIAFLKWFASKYWWSLGILVFLVMTVLLVRTFYNNVNYTGINTNLNQMENRVTNTA